MQEAVKRLVECTIPISHCNLRCKYCYIIQQNRRDNDMPDLKYTPEFIRKAFSKKRWGGTMLVNFCGAGETLMCPGITEMISAVLKEGHYMNVTTNGTISARFDEIIALPEDELSRLCFTFSLHYTELKRTNNLQNFADNVHKVWNAGCSISVKMNLCDDYIDCRDEIKSYCMKNFGALPHVALTRKEGDGYSVFTQHTDEEYINYGREFNSSRFELSCETFRVKRREFCYAGDWSYKLDFATGDLRSCYFCPPFYNIYQNIDEKVKHLTVGNNCGMAYCVNADFFMALGVIPELSCPSYVALRDRPEAGWHNDKAKLFLATHLFDANPQYTTLKKCFVNARFKIWILMSRIKRKMKNIIKKILMLKR